MTKIDHSALIELQYFPSIQYFTKFLLYEKIILEQHENYSKGSYRNRCHIAGTNDLLRLSIPLGKGKNRQMPIREVKIAYEEKWQQQHWSSIQAAYGKAPFFEFYADELQPFFQEKTTYLFDWNYDLLVLFMGILQIQTPILLSESFEIELSNSMSDLRSSILPKKSRQKEDGLFTPIPYPQVFEEKHGFIPNLSILDLLFCAGPQAILILENSINSRNKRLNSTQ